MALVRKIFIDGVELTSITLTEISTLERLDERLDIATLTIDDTKDKFPFPMLADVLIEYTDYKGNKLTFDFKIQSDTVRLTSKLPKLYKHDLTLIESTTKLDRFLCSNLSFTQPTDGSVRYFVTDALVRINAVTPLKLDSQESDKIFNGLTGDQIDELSQIPLPEIFMQKPTMREAINEVFKIINAVVRYSNVTKEIQADFFNRLNNQILDLGDVEYEERQQDIQLYSTTLESDVENLVLDSDKAISNTVVYPNEKGWVSPRTDDIVLTPENAFIEVDQKIDYITKVEFYGTFEDFQTVVFIEKVDFTKFVVENSVWDTLKNEVPDLSGGGDVKKTRRNTIRYERGSNRITFLGTTYGIFGTDPAVELAIQSGYKEQFNESAPLVSPRWSSEFQNFLFRITYVPQVDVRTKSEKEDVSDVNKNTQLANNQSDKIVSSTQYLNNQYGKAQRIGNSTLEIHTSLNDFDLLFNINDFYENLIITEREIISYKDNLIVKYRFDKNFNRLAERIGVDSEVRQFEIPSGNRSLQRVLNYVDYIELSTTSGNEKTGLLTSFGRQVFMNTYIETEKPISVSSASIKTVDKNNNEIGQYFLSCSSNGGGNNLNFVYKFLDNQLVGNQIATEEDKQASQAVKYTDDEGLFEKMTMLLVGEQPIFENEGSDEFVVLARAKTNAKSLPIYNKTLENILISNNNNPFIVKKDPSEIIEMTYQINVLPSPKDVGTIIIGRQLTQNNDLVIPAVVTTKITTSTRYFFKYDVISNEFPQEDTIEIVVYINIEDLNVATAKFKRDKETLIQQFDPFAVVVIKENDKLDTEINEEVTLTKEQVYLYVNENEFYSNFENLNVKSTDTFISTAPLSIDTSNGILTLNSIAIDGKKSWALADEDGRLYFAVNQFDGNSIKTIYHDFRGQRSGIIYDW